MTLAKKVAQYITIDLWDTLYDDDAVSDKRRKLARRQLIADAFGGTLDEIAPYHKGADAWAHKCWYQDQRTAGASERIAHIESAIGNTLETSLRRRLVLEVEAMGAVDPPTPLDGAREFLEEARKSHQIILVSDTGMTPGRVLREILNADGFAALLDGYVFSDEIRAAKPALAPFRAARKLASSSDHCSCHIGDNPLTDVAGALAYGVPALHLANEPSEEYHLRDQYYHVRGFPDMQDFIKARTEERSSAR